MNFSDCEKSEFHALQSPENLLKIPFMKHNEALKHYRYFPLKSGCWKVYDKTKVRSGSEINEYLRHSVNPEILGSQGEGRKKSGQWYIDQKIISFRVSQWGKRNGYDKIRFYGEKFERINRGEKWSFKSLLLNVTVRSTSLVRRHFWRFSE